LWDKRDKPSSLSQEHRKFSGTTGQVKRRLSHSLSRQKALILLGFLYFMGQGTRNKTKTITQKKTTCYQEK